MIEKKKYYVLAYHDRVNEEELYFQAQGEGEPLDTDDGTTWVKKWNLQWSDSITDAIVMGKTDKEICERLKILPQRVQRYQTYFIELPQLPEE